MGADQARDRGARGVGIGQAKLKPRRASVLREVWDRLLDLTIATGFGVLDHLAPLRETPVDRAIGRRTTAQSVPYDRFRQSGFAAPAA
jgi:hypothetical protein